MGQKNNSRFAVGALWLCVPPNELSMAWSGITVWKITEKQSKGYRTIEKIETLRGNPVSWVREQNVQCNYLEHSSSWTHIENLDTIRILYGNG